MLGLSVISNLSYDVQDSDTYDDVTHNDIRKLRDSSTYRPHTYFITEQSPTSLCRRGRSRWITPLSAQSWVIAKLYTYYYCLHALTYPAPCVRWYSHSDGQWVKLFKFSARWRKAVHVLTHFRCGRITNLVII